MKVPLSWLRELVGIDAPLSELRQRLFAIESMSEAEQIFDAYLRASGLEVAA